MAPGTPKKTSFWDPNALAGIGSCYVVTQNVSSKHEVKTHGFYTCFSLLKHGIVDPDDLKEVKMVKTAGFGDLRGDPAAKLHLPLAGPGGNGTCVPGA